jgi:predicted alpha/beta-hydrolase family hydrolase
MCSMAVAGATGATAKGAEQWEEPLAAAGVVLLGYPLHPPGRPERLRTEHLPRVTVPTLMVQGDRDAFGTPDEMAEAQRLIPGPLTSVTIEGARHELKGVDDQIVAALREWLGR